MRINKSISIYGKVQNVGFRFYTQKQAKKQNISGYVKNKADGSVFIEAEGEEEDIALFELWCRQGPNWARVDKIQANSGPLMNFENFYIK